MRHILSLLALTLTSCGAEEPALVPVPTTTGSGMTAEPEDLQTLLDEQTRLSEGLSDTLLFEVPEGTWSLTIVIEGPGTYTLASWTDSEGTALVRDRWIDTEGDWVCPAQLASWQRAVAPFLDGHAALWVGVACFDRGGLVSDLLSFNLVLRR